METADKHDDIVCMCRTLTDKLDYSLSPMDGAIAIGQVNVDLPIVHSRRNRRLSWPRLPSSLRVYTARIDWAGVGLDYVEHGSKLHVIDIWYFSSDNPPAVDGVFPEVEDFDRYVTTCSPTDDAD
ncbi:MAG: hypothetical protein K2Y37_20920 [Pirellulales bacterium]|nr:hypothetical protein [Pirellulales bacterium]